MVSIGPTIGIKGETEYRQGIMRIISQTKELNAEMDLMTAKFKDNESAMSKNKELTGQYAKILTSAQQELGKMQDALGKAVAKHEEAKEKQAKLNEELEKAKQQYGENSKEVKELEKELGKAGVEVEKTGKNVEQWKEKVYQAQTEVVELQKKLADARDTLKHFGEDAQRVGQEISGYGEALTKYITTPLLALGTASVKASSDFTDGMAKIYTIAQNGQKPMGEMRAELEQLSKDTAFSLSDLTEATYQAISASVDTTKAVDFVADATKLARAGFTDSTKAVDLLTTTINAYGLKAEDAGRISDVLLKTQNDGKTILDELASSMGTVIPTAAAYNVNLENLSAAYVVMTKKGINTARATTFLNSMFTELEKSTSTVSKTLVNETGKSMAELMASGMSLGEVLEIIYNSVDRDDEAFAQLWGNVRAGRGGLALVQGGVDGFNTALARLGDSAGQTDYALQMLETPSLKAERAMNQLKIIGVELGDSLIERLYPTFEKVVDGISKLSQAFIDMDDDTMSTITIFGLATAAIGPFIMAIGKVITAVGNVAVYFANLSAGMASALPLVGVLAGAYLELGAAAWAMQDKREKEIESEYGMQDAMKESIKTIDNLKTSHEQFLDQQRLNAQGTQENIDYIEELIRQYNAEIDEEGKVKKGKENLTEVILDELAKALGMEYDDVVALIEKNGKFGDSVEKNISQIKKRAEMAAYEEMYTEAIKRKTVAQAEYEKQEKAVAEQHAKTEQAQREYDKALQEYNEHLKDGTARTGGYEDALQTATTKLAVAKAAENELNDALTDSKIAWKGAESDAEYYGNKIAQDTEKSVDEANNAIKNGTAKGKKNAETWRNAIKESMKVDGTGIGKFAVEGFANGMDAYSGLVKAAAKRVADKAVRQMRASLDINSPSRVMEQIGVYAGMGFVNGLDEMNKKVELASENLADSVSGTAYQMSGYGGYGSNTVSSKTITAPISVNVNVSGADIGDDYGRLADIVADKIATAVIRKEEVFA